MWFNLKWRRCQSPPLLVGQAEIDNLTLWGNYSIPKVYCCGHRNPWRCTACTYDFDRPNYFVEKTLSSVLTHFMLKERLQRLGVLGCLSCIVGSDAIVIHAPGEHSPTSVQEIWDLATQPGK